MRMRPTQIRDRYGSTPDAQDAASVMLAAMNQEYRPSYWYQPGYTVGSGMALSIATLYFTSIYLKTAVRIDRLAIQVTLLGLLANPIRLGIYRSTAAGLPGALLIEAGGVNGTTGGVKELACNITIPAGLSYLAVVTGVAVVTLSQGVPGLIEQGSTTSFGNPVTAYTKASITGSLPASAGAVVATSANVPAIQFRVGS